MKTATLMLALLVPLLSVAQSPWPNDNIRALRPEEVDPYEQYIFQWAIGNYLHPNGTPACVGLFIIQSTGEYVRIAASMELCDRMFPRGTSMNFSARTVLNDTD